MQHQQHIHVIFWGSKWNEASYATVHAALLKLYGGLAGSSYQAVLQQYFDQSGFITGTVSVDSYTDTSLAAPTAVNDSKLQGEVLKAITAAGWTGELNAQFVVLPAPGSTYEEGLSGLFCAYHSYTPESKWPYVFVPYPGDPGFHGCGNGSAEEIAKYMSLAASHEYAEGPPTRL